jgi:predicted DNA binding CopG/RHH family protein
VKYYDEEERLLIESIEKGEWVPSDDLQAAIDDANLVARSTRTKDTRINIRLAGSDLKILKTKALEEGVPYQTLVSSVLHKYAKGKLVEAKEKLNTSPRK